jgi:UDP-N-acetylglucosamine--N-acetylmuramyl-(pentapeptide) pyrophosphoryl-undecaprenol N-acetylglucosamine transferase
MMAALAPRILLAAGGTGGHMFPAEALAQALLRRGLRVELATDERGGGFGDRLPQAIVHRIASGGVAGKGLGARLRNYARLALGVLQSRRLLREVHPAIVVGFGGYPSVPPLWSAQRESIPTILHEQNAVMGRANRFLAARCTRLATGFEQVKFADRVPAGRRIATGNPIRREISAIADLGYDAPQANGPIKLFIVGGSLGARVFSRVVPEAIGLLPPELRDRLHIAQQVRNEDFAQVSEVYRNLGMPVEMRAFFDDVPARLANAHLLVCRAGASTVSELAAAGRPAIMVPLPNSIDDHQMANARALEAAGGGWVLPEQELSSTSLAEKLRAVLENPAALANAAEAARQAGKRDAAEKLADLVIDLLPEDARRDLQQEGLY